MAVATVYGRMDRTSAVSLVVVGTKHELREVPDHASALFLRAVHGPVRCSDNSAAGLHGRLDLVLKLREVALVRDGVVEWVAVLVNADLLENCHLAGLDDLAASVAQLRLRLRTLRPQLLDLACEAVSLGNTECLERRSKLGVLGFE